MPCLFGSLKNSDTCLASSVASAERVYRYDTRSASLASHRMAGHIRDFSTVKAPNLSCCSFKCSTRYKEICRQLPSLDSLYILFFYIYSALTHCWIWQSNSFILLSQEIPCSGHPVHGMNLWHIVTAWLISLMFCRYIVVNLSPFPTACNSFVRLPDDDSILAANCNKWGYSASGTTMTGKWGRHPYTGPWRVYKRPVTWSGVRLVSFVQGEYHCDDYVSSGRAGDVWYMFVR